MVEIEYVIALSKEKKLIELPLINNNIQRSLRKIYLKFDTISARRIKKIESQTNHDVKAVEIFISEKLQKLNKSGLKPWVHFGLTSEDVNNISYSMMWKDGIKNVYLDRLNTVIKAIKSLTSKHSKDALLSFAHTKKLEKYITSNPLTFKLPFIPTIDILANLAIVIMLSIREGNINSNS